MQRVRMIAEEPGWRPTQSELLGDLEVHYPGCSGSGVEWQRASCLCEYVDPTLRLSPEAQLRAMYEEADYLWGDEDEGSSWWVYLRSIGWSEEQVMGRASRPEFADETLALCPGVVYSCFV
jgi:hypothetical protein